MDMLAGIAKDKKSTHRWRSVELSEYSWTFISALLERDISKGLIWVEVISFFFSQMWMTFSKVNVYMTPRPICWSSWKHM